MHQQAKIRPRPGSCAALGGPPARFWAADTYGEVGGSRQSHPQRDVSVRTVALSNHQEVVVTDFSATYDRDGGAGTRVISIVDLRF